MVGTFFYNKIDNRKLLLDYSFIGFPLLKIYPSVGFSELIYSFLSS
jgi:NADH:ubiquinone oxidoreductase subunit C